MSIALIFGFGIVITAMVAYAVVLVGLMEAADPGHSRPEDLTSLEKRWVKGKRSDLGEPVGGTTDAD